MSKVTVDAYHTVGRPYRVAIDPDATVGATLGVDVVLGSALTLPTGKTLPAGYVIQPSDIFNAYVPSGSSGAPGTSLDWTQLTNIPANVVSAAALATVGIVVRQTSGAWVTRALGQPAAGIVITNANGDSGNPSFSLANDLAAVEGLTTFGLTARTAADTWTTRSLVQPAEGLSISNANAVSGNPTFALANDLAAIEALAGTGLAVRTATDTWAVRLLTAPAAGFTITNPGGVAGSPTFALSDDLAALEGLASTGLAARTAANTWAQRVIAVTSTARLTVTNGNGVAGDPTLDLATVTNSGVGSLLAITVDSWGRVSGSRAATLSDLAIGGGTTAQFLRGDGTWSNTLTGPITAYGGRSRFGDNSNVFALQIAYNQTRLLAGQAVYIGGTDSATPDMILSNGLGAELLRLLNNGSMSFGSAGGSFGGGAKVISIQNATTAPTSNPTGGGILYAEGGALKWRGSSGSVTTIGPA